MASDDRTQSRVRRVVIAAGLVLLLPIAPISAECIGPEYPCEAFARAKNVLVVRVTETEVIEDIEGFGPFRVHAHLFIEKVFKGSYREGREVGSLLHAHETWLNPAVGERYLVFSRSGLDLDMCDRTHPLNAQDEFSVIERLAGGKDPPALAGIVRSAADNGLGISGVNFRFDAGRSHAVGTTDDDGTFTIERIDPGSYDIHLAHPDYYWRPVLDSYREIEVTESGCAYTSIRLMPNNRVSGRLLNVEGQPLKRVFLVLEGVGEKWGPYPPHVTTYSKQRGKFEFRGVLPGTYRVEVPFLERAGEGRIPGEDAGDDITVYYPGALDSTEAATIEVTRESEIDLGDFRLPAPVE